MPVCVRCGLAGRALPVRNRCSSPIQDLIKVCVDEKWELRISNGKIIVEKETVELLLKLLNNDRLRSPIDGELFDASAKNHVVKISGT